jgi:hypothetical protein
MYFTSGAHLVSYPMAIHGTLSGQGVKLTNHLHPMPMLRMSTGPQRLRDVVLN